KGLKIFDKDYFDIFIQVLKQNEDGVVQLARYVNSDKEKYQVESRKLALSLSSIIYSDWIYNFANKLSNIISEKALRY
ncbi:MAG TPA: hypothetical protein DEA82_00550, partial [Flavobacteriaceae bacterium]|nr:hypothetical protein [Flavobacteriaceae bacterium]